MDVSGSGRGKFHESSGSRQNDRARTGTQGGGTRRGYRIYDLEAEHARPERENERVRGQ